MSLMGDIYKPDLIIVILLAPPGSVDAPTTVVLGPRAWNSYLIRVGDLNEILGEQFAI